MSTAKKSGTNGNGSLQGFDEVLNLSKQTLEQVVKAGTEAYSKGCEKALEMSQEQIDTAIKMGDGYVKRYEEVLSFGKESVDAFVKSGSAVTKGWQEMTKAMMGFAQAAVEDTIAHGKAVSGVRSIHELIELNQTFAKAGFDKAVAETGKISEMSVKVLEDASAPINGRIGVAVDKLMKPVALS